MNRSANSGFAARVPGRDDHMFFHRQFYLGLDLGKIRDPSALVVVERTGWRLVVRYAERMPLGLPYPRIVERVREIVQSDELRGNCTVVVDATGLGAPVVDMLAAARLGCELTPVVITGGERGAGKGTVPKKELMAEVQMLLERRRLKIGKLREGARLMRELGDIRISYSGGRARMGADGAGEHDDLAIALALACWRAKRRNTAADYADSHG